MLRIYSIIALSLILSQSAYAVEQVTGSAPDNSSDEKKLEVLKPVIPIAPAIPIPSPMPNAEPRLSPENAPSIAKPDPIIVPTPAPASSTLNAPSSEAVPQKTLKSLKDLKAPTENIAPSVLQPEAPFISPSVPAPVAPVPLSPNSEAPPLHATQAPDLPRASPVAPQVPSAITPQQVPVGAPTITPSTPAPVPPTSPVPAVNPPVAVEKQAPQVTLPSSPSHAPEVSLPSVNQTEKTLPAISPSPDAKAQVPLAPTLNGQLQLPVKPQNPKSPQAPAGSDKILTLPGQKGDLKTLKSEVTRTDKVQQLVIPFPEIDGTIMFNQADLSKVEIVYKAYRERMKTSAQPSSAEAAKNDVVGEILGRLKTTNQTVQQKQLPNSVFLNSIMYHSDKDKVAWIDGKKYSLGDALDVIKLVDLTPTQAKIEFNATNYKFDPAQSEALLTDDKQKELVQIDKVAKTITFTIKPNQRIDFASLKVKEGKGKVGSAPMMPPDGNKPNLNPNQQQKQGNGGFIPKAPSGPYTGGIPTSPLQFLNDPAINPAAANPNQQAPNIANAPSAAPLVSGAAPQSPNLMSHPPMPSGSSGPQPTPGATTPANASPVGGISSITSNLKAVLEAGAQLQNNPLPNNQNNNQLQRIDSGVGGVQQKYNTLQELKNGAQNN